MTRATQALVAVAVLGAAVAFAACSLIQSVDDIYTGIRISEAGETQAGDASPGDVTTVDTSADATPDATADAPADAVVDAATDSSTCNPLLGWACWPMPNDTPTNYIEGGAPGIVVDGVTGLQWQAAVGDASTWTEANNDCTSLDAGGTGWRLPTRIELVSLLSLSTGLFPAIDDSAFPSTPPAPYWTSSTLGTGGIFVVDFDAGYVMKAATSQAFYHRCVRAP
jgi:hypothetical protein